MAIGATLVSCSALGQQPATPAASTVEIYGRIDGGLYVQKRSNPSTRLTSISSDTSYIGFRGREDLGGGLSAYFKLEAQVDLGTGAASTPFWNREAFVGLTLPSIGSLQMGTAWSPAVLVTLKIDPFGRAQLGAIQTLIQGANNRGYTLQFTNSVQYITPNLGGLVGRAYVQAPEGTGINKNYSLGLEYTAGSFYAGLAYEDVLVTGATVALPAVATTRIRNLGVGARYDMGFMSLRAYVQNNKVASLDDARSYMLGFTVPVGIGEFRASVGRWDRPNNAGSSRVAVGYGHYLSKRTQVYASAARLVNQSRSTTALWPMSQDFSTNPPGHDANAVGIGMRHLF
jgi:predicted porin